MRYWETYQIASLSRISGSVPLYSQMSGSGTGRI